MNFPLCALFLAFLLLSPFSVKGNNDEIIRLREISDSLHNIGRTDSALIVGEKAIRLAKEKGDKVMIVGAQAGQGVYLRSSGRIEEALKCYESALEIVTTKEYRANQNQESIEEAASLYINLAVLNLDMQHKDEAVKNALLAGEWASRSNDEEFKSTVFGVVGSVLTGCGKLEEASEYQALAYKSAEKIDNAEAAFRASAYTMLIEDRLGNVGKAQEWRNRCVKLLPEVSSVMALLVYYQAECSIALKHDDQREALQWFDKILSLEGIDKLPFVKFDVYNNKHISYAALGEYQNAYKTLLESNELRDSLWEAEKAESLRDLTVKYETKETQLALAQSEAKRANTFVWLLAVAGLLLLAIIIFLLYATRQRRLRLKKEIEFANLRTETGIQLTRQYIEGLENERNRMAKELHDGVCNDLLAVQMNIQNGCAIETTANLIETCRESVRRISHELMPPEFTYATLDEVLRFFLTKQESASMGKVKIIYSSELSNGSWGDIPDFISLEIYRIAQEAVGNALKHSGADEIRVDMTFIDGLITLRVKDNGSFKDFKEKGAGLDSIKKRANSIKGTLNIQSPEKEGTEVLLTAKV